MSSYFLTELWQIGTEYWKWKEREEDTFRRSKQGLMRGTVVNPLRHSADNRVRDLYKAVERIVGFAVENGITDYKDLVKGIDLFPTEIIEPVLAVDLGTRKKYLPRELEEMLR